MVRPLGTWSDRAACLEQGARMFFHDEDADWAANVDRREQALATCRRCPVQEQCLAYALEHDERFGIWGGKTERQRRSIQRAALRAARKAART